MARLFSIAHISDPHLPIEADARRRAPRMAGKQISGYLSWRRRRSHIHTAETLACTVADIRAATPDHVLVTGDLINISLPSEYHAARRWLEALGDPRDATLVPGNHDLTIDVPWPQGLGQWEGWMTGDDTPPGVFPFVRRRGPVAIVGVTTAVPTPVLSARGRIGPAQLDEIEGLLRRLGDEGCVRVVALHHPVTRKACHYRKALADAAGLRAVIARAGAELVVHGHLHRQLIGHVAGPVGPVPVVGVPAASTVPGTHRPGAQWHRFDLERRGGRLALVFEARGLQADGRFATLGRLAFPVPGGERLSTSG